MSGAPSDPNGNKDPNGNEQGDDEQANEEKDDDTDADKQKIRNQHARSERVRRLCKNQLEDLATQGMACVLVAIASDSGRVQTYSCAPLCSIPTPRPRGTCHDKLNSGSCVCVVDAVQELTRG